METNLKIGIFLSPADSGGSPFRHVGDFDLEEPGAAVDVVVGSNVAVELVAGDTQAIVGDSDLKKDHLNARNARVPLNIKTSHYYLLRGFTIIPQQLG